MLHLDCPRCGRVVTEDDRTCRDCGYETSALHWRLTRTAKRRFMPVQKEFKSLYERLGGTDVVEQAVDLFYDRVLADDRIKHFFGQVDTKRLRDKQRDFLSYACGGSVTYDSDILRKAHKHLDLQEEHFTAVVGHLETTLEELGVADDLVQEVVAIASATRDDVLDLWQKNVPLFDAAQWVPDALRYGQRGHRIRVEISSSNFPRFSRNLNTGKPFGLHDEVITATQTIYHDRTRPSHIVLPIIPRQ